MAEGAGEAVMRAAALVHLKLDYTTTYNGPVFANRADPMCSAGWKMCRVF